MTLLATDDRRVICRIQLTGEGRWVSIALSLSDRAPDTQFLVSAESSYEIAGVDDAARKYGLANWQGGIVSGARYAFRALKVPIRQVCLHELRGQLSSADVWAVSAAAALAVARLLDRPPEFPLDLGGWTVEEEIRRLPVADGISQSANVASSQSPPPQDRAENRSPTSGKTGPNHATKDVSVEPSAPTDQPRE